MRKPLLSCLFASAAALSGSARAQSLTIAAAANVRPALDEIVSAFQKKAPAHVTVSYASSGILTQQIENGGPFDLFLSADAAHLDRLEREKLLLPGTRRAYARGRLVLAISRNPGMGIASLGALGSAPLRRLALANPQTAPYGVAARETLEHLRLWDRLRRRIVYAENVRDCLRYAQSGDADYAFAALSEAMGSGLKYLIVPENLHAPIRQEAAVVSTSRERALAAAFLRYLTGEEARKVWARFGYLPG